jgi:hypothetical protein
MVSRSLFFISLIIVAGLSSAFGQETESKKADSVRILAVSVSGPVRDGVQDEFTVEIEYSLDSADAAMASIGFNSDDPSRFRMTGKKKILRGTNVLTLKALVVPKDWKERGDFIVYVNLTPYPVPRGRYTPLASTERVIDFGP